MLHSAFSFVCSEPGGLPFAVFAVDNMDPRRDLGQCLLVGLGRRHAHPVGRGIREIQANGTPEQHADADADARFGRESAIGTGSISISKSVITV